MLAISQTPLQHCLVSSSQKSCAVLWLLSPFYRWQNQGPGTCSSSQSSAKWDSEAGLSCTRIHTPYRVQPWTTFPPHACRYTCLGLLLKKNQSWTVTKTNFIFRTIAVRGKRPKDRTSSTLHPAGAWETQLDAEAHQLWRMGILAKPRWQDSC